MKHSSSNNFIVKMQAENNNKKCNTYFHVRAIPINCGIIIEEPNSGVKPRLAKGYLNFACRVCVCKNIIIFILKSEHIESIYIEKNKSKE